MGSKMLESLQYFGHVYIYSPAAEQLYWSAENRMNVSVLGPRILSPTK